MICKTIYTYILALILVVFTPPAMSQSISPEKAAELDRGFITGLSQSKDGKVWVSTFTGGVWELDENESDLDKAWRKHLSEDIGKDLFLCVHADNFGRIWVGRSRGGVSVYDSERWRTFTPGRGPSGGHVWDIETCEADNNVWMVTNAGLTRYNDSARQWINYTAVDGLPTRELSCIDFDNEGNLWLGTQSSGIVYCPRDSKGQYDSWEVVDPGMHAMPPTAEGEGLPSRTVRDILITKSESDGEAGTVVVATDRGLAWKKPSEENFSFRRGKNWKYLADGQIDTPVETEAYTGDPSSLYMEDDIHSLSEDSLGRIWLGERLRGVEIVDPESFLPLDQEASDGSLAWVRAQSKYSHIRSILTRENGKTLIGTFNHKGLHEAPSRMDLNRENFSPKNVRFRRKGVPRFDSVSSQSDLIRDYRLISRAPDVLNDKPLVVQMEDDWSTKGTWQGRYGKSYARLCSMLSPLDYVWGAKDDKIRYYAQSGPNIKYFKGKPDRLRYWIYELFTKDERALEIPSVLLDHTRQKNVPGSDKLDETRRPSICDDQSEAYEFSHDGPHIFVSMDIPEGLHLVSFYFVNYDGFHRNCRTRDYNLSLREHAHPYHLSDISGFEDQPEIAKGRVTRFTGGVWKRYMVKGPIWLDMKIDRSNSRCTLFSGAFVDPLDDRPAPYFPSSQSLDDELKASVELSNNASKISSGISRNSSRYEVAESIVHLLDAKKITSPKWWAENSYPYYIELAKVFEAELKMSHDFATKKKIKEYLSTCHYWSMDFEKWESGLKSLGYVTPRSVDLLQKYKRDDGALMSGYGHQVLLEYIELKNINRK